MMRLLIDTHCWLWWLGAPERLRDSSRRLIANHDNEVLFSAASSWEIAIKIALGKLHLPSPVEQYVPDRLARNAMGALPVEHIHALRVATLPLHHGDPFDRLLVAQCQVENLPLLTADRQFSPYDIEILPA